jgi:hypothetical protein
MTRRARVLAALLGLAIVLAAVPASRAQQTQRPAFLEGTHAFRRILYDAAHKGKLTPLAKGDTQADPKRTLIVVLGDPDPLRTVEHYTGHPLSSFLEKGGALLVATDKRTPEGPWPFYWSVTGEIMNLARPDGGTAYRGMKECPYVAPVGGANPNLFEPSLPVFRGEKPRPIASNLPSRLSSPSSVLSPSGFSLARRPPRGFSVLAVIPGPFEGQAGPVDFAAGGTVGAGRVLIMADHSVFINEMMLQPDNGNIDFAYRCAEWLLTGPDGRRRDKVLYYEEGVVRTDFDIPLKTPPPPPLPPPETLLGMLDETVHAMEEEGTFARMEQDDYFNGTLEDLMRSATFWSGTRPEWKLWTIVVSVVSVVLGLYAFVRMGMFRHRPDAAGPTLSSLLRRQAPAGAVLKQRQEALLRDGNVWEAARELARDLFVSAGTSPDAGPLPPALAVRGSWWRRWRVRRRWRRLWRLACSARPMRVSPRGFTRLAMQVEAMRAALADGTARVIH